jgi:hypothetical protein
VSGVVDGSYGVLGSEPNCGLLLHPAVGAGRFCTGMCSLSLLFGVREADEQHKQTNKREESKPLNFLSRTFPKPGTLFLPRYAADSHPINWRTPFWEPEQFYVPLFRVKDPGNLSEIISVFAYRRIGKRANRTTLRLTGQIVASGPGLPRVDRRTRWTGVTEKSPL